MGVRAILQRGRGAHNLVLPANAVGQVNNRTVPSPVQQPAPREVTPEAPQAEPSVSSEPPKVAEPYLCGSEMMARMTIKRGPRSRAFTEQTDTPKEPEQPEVSEPVAVPADIEVGAAETAAPAETGFVLTEPESIAIIEEDEPMASVGDDFTKIPGIGQAIARRLKAANINTFEQLLEFDRNRVNRIFGAKADEILAEVRQRVESAG